MQSTGIFHRRVFHRRKLFASTLCDVQTQPCVYARFESLFKILHDQGFQRFVWAETFRQITFPRSAEIFINYALYSLKEAAVSFPRNLETLRRDRAELISRVVRARRAKKRCFHIALLRTQQPWNVLWYDSCAIAFGGKKKPMSFHQLFQLTARQINGNVAARQPARPCRMISLREKRSFPHAGGAGKLPRGQSKVGETEGKNDASAAHWERFRWPCPGHLSFTGAPELSIKSTTLENALRGPRIAPSIRKSDIFSVSVSPSRLDWILIDPSSISDGYDNSVQNSLAFRKEDFKETRSREAGDQRVECIKILTKILKSRISTFKLSL